jgi:AGZA family xanthine/uracil permease-like MFS transporter
VYVGHSGWKAMGGRIGYSAGSGLCVLILCWLGLISVVLAVLPGVAVLPILLYIGLLMGSQAFQEVPRSHAPAVVLAIIPSIASWVLGQVNGALLAAGVQGVPTDELVSRLGNEGVLYRGLETLSQGSVLTGLVFSAVAVFVIERKLYLAALFAAGGAALTFFGFMHGQRLGLNQNPVMAASYLAVAVFLAGCATWAHPELKQDRQGGRAAEL